MRKIFNDWEMGKGYKSRLKIAEIFEISVPAIRSGPRKASPASPEINP